VNTWLNQEINKDRAPATRSVWFGTFSAAVVDIADLASVILPDFDTQLTWGGCRWQSRDATSLPAKGDECIVMFDNRNQPWVVAWWPFV